MQGEKARVLHARDSADGLESAGVRIVLPLTEIEGGARLAYIEGPDDVLIELVQSA